MTARGISPILFESVSAVTATPSVEVGTRRQVGDEEYVYIYNVGSSTIGAGKFFTASLVTGYSVTVSTTTSVDMPLGICKHADIATGSYGWGMVAGFAKFIAATNESFAAGALITCAGDGLAANKTISTGYVAAAFGKAMEAVASAGSGQGFFKFF
jgi:hypothetical protein